MKTWPSFDAEGVETVFSRLIEAFVVINGRCGQRGDVIRQTSTMVLLWFYDGADEKGRIARTAFWRPVIGRRELSRRADAVLLKINEGCINR